MLYYRDNAADCYYVLSNNGQVHQYHSLSWLRLDWPFAKRINRYA